MSFDGFFGDITRAYLLSRLRSCTLGERAGQIKIAMAYCAGGLRLFLGVTRLTGEMQQRLR